MCYVSVLVFGIIRIFWSEKIVLCNVIFLIMDVKIWKLLFVYLVVLFRGVKLENGEDVWKRLSFER